MRGVQIKSAAASVLVRASAVSAMTTAFTRRAFTATTRRSGDAHGPQYDPPTGWLFGVKPGEKYQPEGWENLMFYGFCGSFLLIGVALAFKPDTSIQTWALEEARRRLEAEGILEDPEQKK